MCCGRAKRRNRVPAVLRLCNVGSFGQTGAAIVCALPAAVALRRSPPRSRDAFLRPGGVRVIASDPCRGAGGAPTGALVPLSRVRGATIRAQVRRGASHDAGRSPLGAPPWRFSAGGRASISALPPDPCSELLAARSSCLAGGVPDLPSPRLRAAAAGRHSPLRLQDRLRRRPLLSKDSSLMS